MSTKRDAVKQRQNSAKSTKARPTKRKQGGKGKPFAKGNPWAWQPGESGNPAGRPRSASLGEAYRKILSLPIPNDPHGRTYAEAIAQAVAEKALKADLFYINELGNRAEGRPRQAIEYSGPDGQPLQFQGPGSLDGLTNDELDHFIANLQTAVSTGAAGETETPAGETYDSQRTGLAVVEPAPPAHVGA